MKTTLIFLALFGANVAMAQNYLCSDGTIIHRNSSAPVIHVTIDGAQLECKLTAHGAGPDTCSTASEPVCAGKQALYGDCTTKFGEYGKCFTSDKLGNDGNVVCGCGVGE
ncbi:MAG: hypothetical protein ACXVB9_09015 [Bdellovibrionota bacterium]